MSYKNLRAPNANADVPAAEKVAPVPTIDDARVNGDRVNESADGEAEREFGAPKTLPEGRPPMKLK